MSSEAQKSFSFMKKLPKEKKEKKKRTPPLGTKTVSGIRFDIYKDYRITCADCGAPSMPFVIVYDYRGKCIARRHICIEDSCLYKTAQQFQD